MSILTYILGSVRQRSKVRKHIEEEMYPSAQYVILLLLSCIIAFLGIISNQPTVTIGSMLLSPMMWPILGTAVGVAASKPRTILIGLATFIGSALFAVGVSYVLTLLINPQTFVLNTEITSRITPTLLDLLIALATGVAGVLILSWEKGLDAAAGIAMASSLLPPLIVMGIGYAIGNTDIIYGSGLLFLTNAGAIIFTGILLFLAFGHHKPDNHIGDEVLLTAALATSFVTLALLALPLTFTLVQIVSDTSLAREVKTELASYLASKDNRAILDTVTVHKTGTGSGTILQIEAILRTDDTFRLSYSDTANLKGHLEKQLGQTVSIDLRSLPSVGGLSESLLQREMRTQETERLATLIRTYLMQHDPRILIDSLRIGAQTPVQIALVLIAPPATEFSNEERKTLLQLIEKETDRETQLDISILRTDTIKDVTLTQEQSTLDLLEAAVDEFTAHVGTDGRLNIASRNASVKDGIYTLRIVLRIPADRPDTALILRSLQNTLRTRFSDIENLLRIEVGVQEYDEL